MSLSSNRVRNKINFTILNFQYTAWLGSFISLHIATRQLYCILLFIYHRSSLDFLCGWFNSWFMYHGPVILDLLNFRLLYVGEAFECVVWLGDSSFWWIILLAKEKKKNTQLRETISLVDFLEKFKSIII